MLRFPRRLRVGFLRAIELIALRIGGRRWKIDRFNQLIEGDVRETATAFRASGVRVIVGIPFHREVDNLASLVMKVQAELHARGESAGIVIVGERKTRKILLDVPLPPPLARVQVARLTKPFGFGQKPGLSRRSWSHWEILQVASRCPADLVFIDADVRNSEGWIDSYLDAIQNRGAMVAVADYVREFARDDAIVHIWDSLIFGALFRKWIAFRHGGDYALSREFVPAMAWDQSIMRERTYTMDSAVIARAVRSGARIEAVWLGTKEHAPIPPEKLFSRLPDLVRSVFDDIAAHLPVLLRLPLTEPTLDVSDTTAPAIAMRELIGPDFRRDLYRDAVNRFQLAASRIRRTLGSTQFGHYSKALAGTAAEAVEISPRAWARATLRFLTRYIRSRDGAAQNVLVNAYVPLLELGVLGFLNRTFELSYAAALRCLKQDYLPAFQQIWNGLSRRLLVYRMAALRRWPIRAARGLAAGVRRTLQAL
jgi:hypothetical protein